MNATIAASLVAGFIGACLGVAGTLAFAGPSSGAPGPAGPSAEEMEKASEVYGRNRSAMQLRAMNMTYESIKERGALMVVPSGMAESINPGVIGMAAAGFRHDGEAS